jgi:hypothetical protein
MRNRRTWQYSLRETPAIEADVIAASEDVMTMVVDIHSNNVIFSVINRLLSGVNYAHVADQ